MLYHVVRRPPHNSTTNSSNQSTTSLRSGSVPPPTLMPRYHYSRNVTNSAANNPTNLFLTRNHFDGQTSKQPAMPAATVTNNNNNLNSNTYGTFKSTIIPLVTNNRTTASNKREFIEIPVTRDDGTSVITNHQNRSVPINFINETNVLPPAANNNNHGTTSPRPIFTNHLRPTSRYFQYHNTNNNNTSSHMNSNEEPFVTATPMAASNVPRLPSVLRRLSLTIPVTTNVTTNTDDNVVKQPNPSSQTRQIPIRLPQPTNASASPLPSNPSSNSRISSAILRTSPISNALQRQKTEIGEGSLSSPTLPTQTNSLQTSFDCTAPSSIRRAELMAREAIQGITRLQQQRNNSLSDINQSSPPSARRVLINLKNNQSISLDSRLSSSSMKPPAIPPSLRLIQRNNLYHIPVLHEIQLPSYPTTTTTIVSENSSATTSTQNGNYKNEFHMEIPVTVTTTNHDQENQRISSANQTPRQTLKSILKRSSSRETVSRKNVSFMNA